MSLQTSMAELNVRPAAIIHLATMLSDCEAPPEILLESFDDDFDVVLEALGLGEESHQDFDAYLLYDALSAVGKLEWLVKFEAPIPTAFYGADMDYSWGFYTSTWIYGDTYNSCCQKALKWRNKFIEEQRKGVLMNWNTNLLICWHIYLEACKDLFSGKGWKK